jgi:ankyrin repeat protein
LDETYGRMLKNINERNQQHARRLLHCLTVAVRPLRVEELADILAFDFDGAHGGIPKFHSERRPNDQEEAVLFTCSSLISIVGSQDSRVVQFSHLSVKEFLISNHLASSPNCDLSLYHILPGPAHTILSQVCLGILLDLDGQVSPLAEYAAQHWAAHAQSGDVALHVMDGMKTLFDRDEPHFAAWIDLFDIDADSGGRLPSETRPPTPLYCAALYGFHDLVRHLASEHPQDVNAIGGSYEFPLFAALCRNHFGVAEILLEHGADVNIRGDRQQTALHKAIDWDDQVAIDAAQFLLEHGADVNAQQDDHWTPLHLSSYNGKLEITRLLLDHGADANAESDDGETALHEVSCGEYESQDAGIQIARLLLERGADVNAQCDDRSTPLHFASYNGKFEIARLLLDRGANANAESDNGETALHRVSCGDYDSQDAGVRVTELLLEHGADVNAQRSDHWTPLHLASYLGKPDVVRVLLNHGAKVDAVDSFGKTPLHDVAKGTYDHENAGVDVARLLLKHGADVNALTWSGESPLGAALDAASHCQRSKLVDLLLDNDP